ncbi:MAG: signal peptidase I [Micrococcales bacterium]|nr:signal peptidase I [Micrococcales bacterium]
MAKHGAHALPRAAAKSHAETSRAARRGQGGPRGARTGHAGRMALRVLVGLAGLAALALIALVVVVPRINHGTALTVLTGSMRPTIQPGDMVATRGIDPATACDRVQAGDVIAYRLQTGEPTLITHRVVAKNTQSTGASCTFITQGDANPNPDDPVLPAQVRGVVMYRIPWVGHVTQWRAGHPRTALGVLGGALVLIALAIGLAFRRPSRRRSVRGS